MKYETVIESIRKNEKDALPNLLEFYKKNSQEVSCILLRDLFRDTKTNSIKTFKEIMSGDDNNLKRNLMGFFNDYFRFCINGSLSSVDEIKSNFEEDSAHYHYIPFPPERFIYLLKETKKYNKKRFLDVGSGTGHKPILAYLLDYFETCHGIEYNPITFGKSMYNKNRFLGYDPKIKLFNGDALEFGNYADYDYIYMYKPMHDDKQMHKLYDKILTDCKIGTLIVNVLDFYQVLRLEKSLGFGKFTFLPKGRKRPIYNNFVLLKQAEDTFKVEPFEK